MDRQNMHNQVNSKEQVKYTGESKLHGTGKRQLVVRWCITPSQPVRLYQGDVNEKGQVKYTKRQRTGKIYTGK